MSNDVSIHGYHAKMWESVTLYRKVSDIVPEASIILGDRDVKDSKFKIVIEAISCD